MASKTRLQSIIIFTISLSNLCLIRSSSSWRPLEDHDQTSQYYRKWLSWNLENYGNKIMSTLQPQSMSINGGGGGGGGKALDIKLRKAEMNKLTLTVTPDGSADYATISDALNSIPLHNTRRVILVIKPGVYRTPSEKITIPRALPFVTFLGNDTDPPTITGNDTASVIGRNGLPLKTFQSATVGIDANYFVAINIKFENTAPHVIGSVGGQAVALRISGTKAAFYNCSFYGSQDTLYDHKGLHYFHNCFIQGSVDFIFGYGRSLYENCGLNSVGKKVASLTAQKRSTYSMASGFSFKDCVVTGSGTVYLGRAWGDYSRVVFAYTYMDKLVLPRGWSDWGKTSRDPRVYYGEYKCSGPGANSTARVAWAHMLTDEEAQPFLGTHYVDGHTWLIN